MAKKGNMQFNSAAAKAKWSAIQNGADHSIESLVQGTAKQSDIEKIGSTLKEMSKTASTVFQEAVDAAAATVANVGPTGSSAGGNQSLFEKALNAALQPSLKELLASIKDIIEIESQHQIKDVEEHFDKTFADFAKEFSPTANAEALAELKYLHEITDANTQEAVIEEQEQKSLLDKIYDKLTALGHDIQGFIKGPTNEHLEQAAADRFVSGPDTKEVIADAVAEGAETAAARSGGSLTPTTETEGQSLERQRQAHLFDRLESFLDSKDQDSNKADAEKDKEEEEKADAWWKSFGRWVLTGSSKKKGKDGGGILDTLKDLGTMGLLMAIFDPQMWTGLAHTIEKYITWDNLKKAFFGAWDWLKSKTTEVIDWAAHQLGLKDSTKDSESKTVKDSAAKDLSGAKTDQDKADLIARTEKTDPAKARAMWAQASPGVMKAYADSQYGYSNTAPAPFVPGQPNGGATVTQKDAPAFANRADAPTGMSLGDGESDVTNQTTQQRSSLSVNPSTTTNNANMNGTVINQGANSQPATTVPLPGGADPGAGTNNPPLPQAVQGAAPTHISSYGFTQGVSDSLLLMNSSILGY